MYGPYPRFANPLTQLDNTAKNPLGFVYQPPWGSYPTNAVFSTTTAASTAGYGAPPIFKYVYFNPVTTTAFSAVNAPAPVYYTDESCTQVSPYAQDAYSTTNGVSLAGYWMPNTTTLGSSYTAAQWGAQFPQTYGWIAVSGLVTGAYAPTTQTSAAIGNVIYGATTGAWASVVNTALAAVTAGVSRLLGLQWSTIANSQCDVFLGAAATTFWGS